MLRISVIPVAESGDSRSWPPHNSLMLKTVPYESALILSRVKITGSMPGRNSENIMQAAIGDERVLHKNQRARLRDQLAAWDRLSKPAAAVQTMITAESQAEAQIQSSTVPVICSREWSRKLWECPSCARSNRLRRNCRR